jgi:hypothetical protein
MNDILFPGRFLPCHPAKKATHKARFSNKKSLFLGFFLSGDFFQAGPPAIRSAVISQVGVVAADAVEDLSPLLHLPLQQKVCLAPPFRALTFPDAPLGWLFHGKPPGIMILFLPLESKFSEKMGSIPPSVEFLCFPSF